MSGASIGISVQTALHSGLLCRVAGQARGCMAEDRAEAFCRGLGKTLSSSPDLGISLSTVSIYQHTLFYPNTCAEINSEDLIGLSAGQSLSVIIRQLTTGMFASDPKEGRVLFLSLSCLASFRWMLLLSCLGAAGVRVTPLGAGLPESRRTDRPGQGSTSPSA